MPGTLMQPEDSRAKTYTCSDTENLDVCSAEDRNGGHQKLCFFLLWCGFSFLYWFFAVARTSFLWRFLLRLGLRSCCGFCCVSGLVPVTVSPCLGLHSCTVSTVTRASFWLRFLLCLGLRSCYGFCCVSGFVLAAVFAVSRDSFLLRFLLCLGLRSCCGFCCDSGSILAVVFAVSRASFLLRFLCGSGSVLTAVFAVSRAPFLLRFFTVSRTSFWLRLLLWLGPGSCCGFYYDSGFVLGACLGLRSCCGSRCVSDLTLVAVSPCLGLRP